MWLIKKREWKNKCPRGKFLRQYILSIYAPGLGYVRSLGTHKGQNYETVYFFIVAVSSMWSVFSSESLAPKDIWQTSLASKLIPAMNRLLEDDSVKVNIICSFSGWGQLLKTLAEIITFWLSPSFSSIRSFGKSFANIIQYSEKAFSNSKVV